MMFEKLRSSFGTGYTSVGEKSSNEHLLENQSTSSDEFEPRRGSPNRLKVCLFSIVFVFGCLISFFVGMNFKLDRRCMKRTSLYSPALNDINPELHKVRFNGTLGRHDTYIGEPSEELDAAWDRVTISKFISASREDIIRSGASLDAATMPEEYGGGYFASLEVTHQLHCLNMLRKALQPDYYMSDEHYSHEFNDRPFTIHIHLQHCVEMLRVNIMCNADMGLISHHWIKDYPIPYPNFNTNHMCRDWDSVEGWLHEHEIRSPPEGYHFPVLPGTKVWDDIP